MQLGGIGAGRVLLCGDGTLQVSFPSCALADVNVAVLPHACFVPSPLDP